MLNYLNRKESILISLKNGLVNKEHSFKELAGINARIDLLQDIKSKYNKDILEKLINNTNYPILLEVKHGLDNVYNIDKQKHDWYLYAVNMNEVSEKDTVILRKSILNKNTLIYESEKSIIGEITNFYVIFSKEKYDGSHQYVNNKWQGR